MNRRTLAEIVALVVATILLFAVVGAANPLHLNAIDTDHLGPDSGEKVTDYIGRANARLASTSTSNEPSHGNDDLRWALVSFADEMTSADAFRSAGGARISQVLFRVPIDRVQTPVLTQDVPGDEESVDAAAGYAASRLNRGVSTEALTGDSGSAIDSTREGKIDAVTVARLTAGCACVVALTVRADQADLRALARQPGIRAVESLPSGAVGGRFSVRPLLPEQTEFVLPQPDDGIVPDR